MTKASEIIMAQLDDYGADAEKAMTCFIDDPDLYVTCLVAFSLDDKFDKLERSVINGMLSEASELSAELAAASGRLQIIPLETKLRHLGNAAAEKDVPSVLTFFSSMQDSRKKFMRALCIENNLDREAV